MSTKQSIAFSSLAVDNILLFEDEVFIKPKEGSLDVTGMVLRAVNELGQRYQQRDLHVC